MTAPPSPAAPSPRWRGRRIAYVVATLALVYAVIVGAFVLQSGPDASPAEESAVLIAVGNLGGPESPDANALAHLLSDRRMDALALLGDLAGPTQDASAWSDRYAPLFATFDRVARPAPGEEEYQADGASAYHAYYSSRSGGFASASYYAFSLAGWRIYSLDSVRGGTLPGDEMYEWLRNDLRNTSQRCVAAFWNQPVYTAGPDPTDTGGMQRVFELLAAYDADVVLAAHDANYQRWEPIDGITSFVVGTGGAGVAAPTRTDDRLAASSAEEAGALQLELGGSGADYRYLGADGTVIDSGTIKCHGRPSAEPPRPAAPTSLTAQPGATGVSLSWDPVGGEPAPIGYLVFRGTLPIAFSSEPSYVDTSLPPGASVLYSVRAVTAAGARSPSSETVHSGGTAPGYTDYTWGSPQDNPSAPTADKPQSKLWWADGTWWGVLYGPDPTRPIHSSYYIQRFDAVGQGWTNTGMEVDERNRSRADVLWDPDSENLYVVSTIASGAIKLYRYSFAAGAYTLDSGFPLRLTEDGSESATIAKDSTGVLWVTMTQLPDGSGPCASGEQCEVKIMHSTDAEYRWTDPVTIPVDGAVVSADDISAVASYDGNIAVAWSNQLDGSFFVASHVDGAADTAWRLKELIVAPRGSDDHLNLKADNEGRLYLIGKTSLNDPANSSPDAPLVVLFVRDMDGTWRTSTVWAVRDDVTRPEIVIDENGGRIYAVAAHPGTGGDVVAKSASITDLDFGPELGSVLMAGGLMNNPTLTKQTVDVRDGILVLAGDSDSHTYWHNLITPETVIASGP